jgi:hypothetical protein
MSPGWRTAKSVFVEVLGEHGPYHREIGELSRAKIRSLQAPLRIRVVDRLLEHYLAEQAHIGLFKDRHPYTKVSESSPSFLLPLCALLCPPVISTRRDNESRSRGSLLNPPMATPNPIALA